MLDVSVPSASVLWQSATHVRSEVTVAVTLYNYGSVVLEALESVRTQTLQDVDLVVVDDCSTDGGERAVGEWVRGHGARFGRSCLLRHVANQGLAAARNQAFSAAETPYVFVLDADNLLYPRCLEACRQALNASRAEAAYTLLEVFGESSTVMNSDLWDAERLLHGNFIDAMALVRHDAWRDVGGYRRLPVHGWEDFDFWLKFVESGFEAVRVPEILARYRYREASMLRAVTNRADALARLHADLRRHHPAVRLAEIPPDVDPVRG